jgi:glycosyltransferase involved in cell wall biosynthesis
MVLWLATLSPGKQPSLFIELAAALQEVAGWRFVLAGGTSDRAFLRELEQRASRLPALDLVGSVPFPETTALFARAALYVNTSRPDADGLPNAFIQAWLQGTPVLSLHHDPNGWIARHGLGFCARGNVGEMQRTCRALLSDPGRIEPMRSRCVAFARETFSNPRVIDTYLDLFAGKSAAEPSLCPVH